ncbi:MAG: hypothetical protein J3R72DRAFT_494896 [Linnemannia gamsii]|nr:MAG: hypothetical protein J3R72DRAFT_494896 [Linnemannia gamsii]
MSTHKPPSTKKPLFALLPYNGLKYTPLDVPGIRAIIARYLTRTDCISCMCVCRDWLQDFIRPVWHTIDFSKDFSTFSAISPDSLTKYGGYGGLISEVLNVTATEHLQALQHSFVDQVKVLTTQLVHSCMNHLLLSDTIRRNQKTLRELDIHCKQPNPDTFAEQRRHGQHYLFSMDAILSLSPPPLAFGLGSGDGGGGGADGGGLTKLKLAYVCITRESFSALLQRCQSLQELTLHRVLLLNHRPSLTLFAGSGLPHLVASLAQIWDLDPNDLDAPSLLEHFPLLETWHIPSLASPANITVTEMRKDISWCCPVLKEIRFGEGDSATAADILANALTGLESCTLSAWILSSSTVLGLVAHQDTLTSVTITTGTSSPTSPTATTSDESHTSAFQNLIAMEWLYMIPRLCRHLHTLSMEPLVCDIDSVEKYPWGCQDVQQLRVRFKGLETPQEIDVCLLQMCDRRRFEIAGSEVTKLEDEDGDGDGVLARVVRFFLQFKRLSVVWLGTKEYYMPPAPPSPPPPLPLSDA